MIIVIVIILVKVLEIVIIVIEAILILQGLAGEVIDGTGNDLKRDKVRS